MTARAEVFAILIVASFTYFVFRVLDYFGTNVLDQLGLWPF